MSKRIAKIASGMLLTAACSAAPGGATRAEDQRSKSAAAKGKHMTSQDQPIHQRYASLDAYLLDLERTQGPIDRPWYKEVSPGVYHLQTGNLRLDTPGEDKRIFTRRELELKFGFSK